MTNVNRDAKHQAHKSAVTVEPVEAVSFWPIFLLIFWLLAVIFEQKNKEQLSSLKLGVKMVE